VGGPSAVVASDPLVPYNVASDGAHAYYTTSTAVQKVPVAGGAIVSLASPIDYGAGIAVDATDVFFTTSTTIARVPKDGGPVTVLASGLWDPRSVALQGDDVYSILYNTCEVLRVPKAGGPVQMLGPSSDAGCLSVAVDGLHAYAIGSEIHRWPLAGGPDELVSPIGGFDIALNATHAFVAGSPYVYQLSK
jgi:hypothetical protein